MNRQAWINLIVYTLLAMHAMAFDQLIPVFMQHDPMGSPDSTPYEFPLKFAGGFGLNHFQIGLMSTGYGIVGKHGLHLGLGATLISSQACSFNSSSSHLWHESTEF